MYHPKNTHNWGSLIRTANLLKANFIATIGRRFPKQSSDTLKSHRHIPIYEYSTFEDFKKHLPYSCEIVGVELDDRAKYIHEFTHPARAVYLLGAEDKGLPPKVRDECHRLVKLKGRMSMNVACAGSIVLYDRVKDQTPGEIA